MMKNLLVVLLVLVFNVLNAQITITNNDMPNANDTFRLSETFDIQGLDPALTGTNYIWNFSTLTPTSQRIDTFFSVSSTPFTYQWFFNNSALYPNHKASYALRGQDIGIPQVPITEVFNYIKNSSVAYDNVGFGSNIAGVPSSTQNIPVDREYVFPMNYNDNHTSFSEYGMSIPTFGYYGQSMTRIDTVDGWGSVTTPYGTFNCLRVKSVLQKIDTTYIDLAGFGFITPRPDEIEYKWLAAAKGVPILKIVTTSGFVSSIEYQDSARVLVSVPELTLNAGFEIYPNPACNILNVTSENSIQSIEIIDITGKSIRRYTALKNKIEKTNISELANGVYFIKVYSDKGNFSKKFVKN